MLTEAGSAEIDVPRDRDSSFEPKLVAKRARRLSGVDKLVISLSAKGLNRPFCFALAVTVEGTRDILGLAPDGRADMHRAHAQERVQVRLAISHRASRTEMCTSL